MDKPTSLRFFRALTSLYPRAFRHEFGQRMEEAFLAARASRNAEGGGTGPLRFWTRILWDTLVHGLGLRLRPSRRASTPRPRRSEAGPPEPRGSSGPGAFVSNGFQDLRFALRTLRRSPTLSVVVVLIAALGISLATLVFTIVNAAFLRPLPHVRSPQELVVVSRRTPSQPGRPGRLAFADYDALRESGTALRDLVGVMPYQELLLRTTSEMDRKVVGGEVTENYFQALGIPMVLGRGILPEDERSGGEVAVLGHTTWLRDFGGNPEVLGQTVRVDGHRYTVVGVAPPGLGWLSGEPVESAVWIPVRPRYRAGEDAPVLLVAGRLPEGTSIAQLQGELDAVAAGLAESDPHRWTERSGTAVGLRGVTERQARLEMIGGPRGTASLLIYLVFVGLIMLITCSNVATLLLNRALRRRPEIALRLALGAGRGRLVRLLLTESLLLFLVAGLLGVLGIHAGTRLLAAGWGASLPVVAAVTVDLRVALFAGALTVASGLIFGLVPALQATGPSLAPALKGRSPGRAPGRFGPRNLLVLAQVSASMVLVTISSLLVRDVERAASLDLGFHPEGVAVASLDLRHGEYGEEEGRRFLAALAERLEGRGEVEEAALSAWVPMAGSRWNSGIRPEGVDLAPGETVTTLYNAVTPGYFGLVGMPLLAGRDFQASDEADAPPVLVVNEAFGRRFWPGQDPVGKRVSWGDDGPGAEIVGVVRDAMYGLPDLKRREAEPHLWVPRAQRYHDLVQVHVRARGAVGPALAALRDEIRLLDDDLPILELSSMEGMVGRALVEERAGAALFGGFSGLALLLAALGIYGVMAHAVLERTREMGVRLAVGAAPGRVLGLILTDTLRLSALGVGIGLGLAILVGLGIRTLLVGTSVVDPASLSAGVVVLTLAAVLAGLQPALRAARLDPVRSLKCE